MQKDQITVAIEEHSKSTSAFDQYRILFDMAADCLLILDMTGRIVEINQNGCAQRGYSRDEMLGRRISEFDPPEFASKVPERMKVLLSFGKARFESAHVCKDGRVMPVEINARVVEFNGQPHVFSVIRDITEQQRLLQTQKDQTQFLHAIFDDAVDGILVADISTLQLTSANPAICRMLGYSEQELLDMRVPDVHPHQDWPLVQAEFEKQARGEIVIATLPVLRKDRSVFLADVSAAHLEQHGSHFVVGFFRDITERRQSEESQKLAQMVFDNSGEAIMVTDASNRIVAINAAFTEITGYDAEESLGRNPRFLSSGRQLASFYKAMWEQIEQSGKWQGEVWNRHKNGELYAERLAINTIYHSNGLVHRRIGMFSDITDKKKADELIWQHANFDLLTGLPNRRMMRDRLAQEIRRAHRANGQLALLFIDLDRFKEVNDSLGHHVGDELLVEAAKRLETCVRETDTVARLGGDEFTLILSELHGEGIVEMLARNINLALAKPYHLGGEEIFTSASIGIALYPSDSVDPGRLLQYADQAMYAAKEQGKNRFHFFTPELQTAAQVRLKLISDLSTALKNGQFQVFFQPIVNLSNNHVFKAEALLRWNHPTRGMVSPADFVPLLEDTGQIMEVGEWVFQQSMYWAKRWSEITGVSFQISVNKSPVQFRNADQSSVAWPKYLQQIGGCGSNLAIEITEGLLLQRDKLTTEKLLQFRDAGIQVAIDDFGTGYSALSYLKKFDIDYLKIDQSFVSNMVNDPADFALCEAMVVMAHKLGLKVIAEGVETVEQRELLTQIACDLGQGYLFARPMPAEELDAILRSGSKL